MAETTRNPFESSLLEKSLMAIVVVFMFGLIISTAGWPSAAYVAGWIIVLSGITASLFTPLFFHPFLRQLTYGLGVVALGCVLLFTGKAYMEPVHHTRDDTETSVVTETDAPHRDATSTDDDTECGYYCSLQRDYNSRNP